MPTSETPADNGPAGTAPRVPSRQRWIALSLLAALALGGLLALWLPPKPEPQPIQDADDDDIDPMRSVANPGYVGVDACTACHSERVAEYRKTRHFKACVPATEAAAPGFTPGRGFHPTRDPNLHFEMTRLGDALFATGVHVTPQGKEQRSYQIDLVYGAAGKSDEMYFGWEGEQLYIHPVGWLYPSDRWGHAADVVHARPALSRCLECHNTWIAHGPGTLNRYRHEDMILGVGCERCHGPGREHVAHHQREPKGPAFAIVHPGNLTRERRMEVCTQCHSNSFNRRGPAFSYRPGEPLGASVCVTKNTYPEDDLVGNQVQYLRESKCFQKSEMTCVTCHDPHRPHQHEATSRSCLRCHTPAACPDQPRLPTAVRADCAGCHMPPRVWMGAQFHTTTDQYVPVTRRSEHRIAVYPEARKTVLLAHWRMQSDAKSKAEADLLASQLTRYWLDRTDAMQREGRLWGAMRTAREAVLVDPSPAPRKRLEEAVARQVEFDRLVADADHTDRRPQSETAELLKNLLVMKPHDAKTHGKLGTVYAGMGKRTEAVFHLEAVARYDPNDSFGLTTLAKFAYLDQRWEEAATLCARADEISPYNADIQYQWGLSLSMSERWTDAAVHFRRALEIDPKHIGGTHGLSEALRRLGSPEEAVRHARRAARWTNNQNVQVLLTLADAYTDAKRPTEARSTLRLALSLAEVSHPALVPIIRARLLK